MEFQIPSIASKFVCIVDHKCPQLAAVISSYIALPGEYPLIFEFPTVTTAYYERTEEEIDEHQLSLSRAEAFATLMNNILVRVSPVENLIIAGLSEDQISYLDFLRHFNIIRINDITEVDFALSPFIAGKGTIKCREDEFLLGLNAALRSNSILQFDSAAGDIPMVGVNTGGLVIIEKEPYVSTVLGVNYAHSIGADVILVDNCKEEDRQFVLDEFSKLGSGDPLAGDNIKQFLQPRIEGIVFSNFKFVTFFTTGLPYSFAIGNIIPSTYVHLHMDPDFFIVNNILFHGKTKFGGAVVFSPGFFEDEETQSVKQKLTDANYFVKELLGKNADVFNFSKNIQHFPYDVFHICTHGGEVEGHTVEEEFTDRDGNRHTVIYESLLSFFPSLRPGLLTVQHMTYFKFFDGMVWRSPELEAKEIPHYVFADMQNYMKDSKAVDKKIGEKKKVSNSAGIQCSDMVYLPMLQTIASHTAPFIFNNACWSWLNVAERFLGASTRSYIGTFWNVQNHIAVAFAKQFYELAFTNSIMESVHRSQTLTKGSDLENIYMVWGLHFSKLSKAKNIAGSRELVYDELMLAVGMWQRNLKDTPLASTRDNIEDILKWLFLESRTTFTPADFTNFKKRKGIDERPDPKKEV